MAKSPFTPNTVANLKPRNQRYERPDPGCRGLRVTVFPSGAKSFVVRFRFKGKPCKVTLGPVLSKYVAEPGIEPVMGAPLSLAAARSLCAKLQHEVASGRDPRKAKRREQEPEANTLRDVCEEHLRLEAGRLRTLDSQRRPDLELFYPALGHLPIDQIKRSQFFDVLEQVAEERGRRRAGRAFSNMKAVLSRLANRNEDFINRLSRAKWTGGSAGERDRTLSNDELRAVWLAAEADQGPFGAYIRFVLLTGCRRNEAAGLRRDELNEDGTEWLIPGSRYKSKRDTLIPLSRMAQEIIAARPAGTYVFSSDGTRPLTAFSDRKEAFDKVCGVSGYTLHDLRRTSRTLLSQAGVRPDIAELCLGHTVGGIRGRYDKFQFRAEKAEAFEKLSALIAGIVAGVVVRGSFDRESAA